MGIALDAASWQCTKMAGVRDGKPHSVASRSRERQRSVDEVFFTGDIPACHDPMPGPPVRTMVSSRCPMPPRETIFHIAEKNDWERALRSGDYHAPSLESEGFIHCSSADQVVVTANRYFAARRGLLLLEIDAAGLSSLVFEAPAQPREGLEAADQDAASPSERFPHVYGRLPVERVRRVFELESDETGRFSLPEGLRD